MYIHRYICTYKDFVYIYRYGCKYFIIDIHSSYGYNYVNGMKICLSTYVHSYVHARMSNDISEV